MTRLQVLQLVGALQLATMDHRKADVDLMIADLGNAELRDVVRELLTIFDESTEHAYDRAKLRAAIAADALDQAAIGDGQ